MLQGVPLKIQGVQYFHKILKSLKIAQIGCVKVSNKLRISPGCQKICFKWIQGFPLKIQSVQNFHILKSHKNCSIWVRKVSNQLRISPGCQKTCSKWIQDVSLKIQGVQNLTFFTKSLKIAQFGCVRYQINLEIPQGVKTICYKWIQGVPLEIQGVQNLIFFYKISQNCINWVCKVSNQLRISPGCQKHLFQVDTECFTWITGCSKFDIFLQNLSKLLNLGV